MNEYIKIKCKHYSGDVYSIFTLHSCAPFDCIFSFKRVRKNFIIKRCYEGIIEVDWITYLTKKEHFEVANDML